MYCVVAQKNVSRKENRCYNANCVGRTNIPLEAQYLLFMRILGLFISIIMCDKQASQGLLASVARSHICF